MPYTTYTDIENGKTKKIADLDLIAAHLRLSIDYLRTDKGDPEDGAPPAPVMQIAWPFPDVALERIVQLDPLALELVNLKLKGFLEEVERETKKRNRRSG